MRKIRKIALGVVAMVVAGIGFVSCGDDGKSPLAEIRLLENGMPVLLLQSRDDETIIKKITISGRNGKCDIKHLGTGRGVFLLDGVKYGEKLPYDTIRVEEFDGRDDKCPPKNGKYEIELDTNFGTYYYELGK